MSPTAARLLACAALALLAGSAAPPARPSPPALRRSRRMHGCSGPWTGRALPAPLGADTAQACLSEWVVIFTRDVVLRATLTSNH